MQFLNIFQKISFYVPTQSTQQKRKGFTTHILKRTLQCFASKTLQNDSKGVEKFQLRFFATCVLFESFWSQNVGKRSTKTEIIIYWDFKGRFADFGWKMAEN